MDTSWATEEGLPFVRAVRLIPPAMKEKLPGHYLNSLDARVRPYADQMS